MQADGGFGATVRRLRRRLTLSQEDLAHRAEVDPRTLRTIESGRSTPRGSTLRRLADALELTDDERTAFYASANRPAEKGPATARTERPEPTAEPPTALPPTTRTAPARRGGRGYRRSCPRTSPRSPAAAPNWTG